jgi:hypothetical protein
VVNKELCWEMNNFKSYLPVALFPVSDGFVYEKPPDVFHPMLSGACYKSSSTEQIFIRILHTFVQTFQFWLKLQK